MKIKDVLINYVQFGEGKDVVLLHGWGQNIQMMMPLADTIKNSRITIIDLPGFGESGEPNYPWTLNDYCQFLKELFKRLDVKNPILIGHSFGGKIAVLYASENKVNKLVLLGSPCFKSEITLKTRIIKTIGNIKFLSKLKNKFKKYIGSTDYKNASNMMREILVKHVNSDLTEELKKISSPTIIIWGKNDEVVSIEDAKKIEQLIHDSGLIVLEGTHYAYLENLNHVGEIINEFIKEL